MSGEEEGTAASESPEATENPNPAEESEDEEVILNTKVQNRRGLAVEPSPIDHPKSNRRGQSKKTNQDLPLVGGSASTKKVKTGRGQSKTSIAKTAEKRKLPNKENADDDLSVASANASETQVNTRRGRSNPTTVDHEPEIVAAVSRNVQTRRGRRKEVLQNDELSPDEQPTPIVNSTEKGNTRRGSAKAVEPGNASKQAIVSEKRKTPRGKKENTEHLDIPMTDGNFSSEQVTTRRGGSSRGVEPEICPELSPVAEIRKPQRDRKTNTEAPEENLPTTSSNVDTANERKKRTAETRSGGKSAVEVNKYKLDEEKNQSSTPARTSNASRPSPSVQPSATRRSSLAQVVNTESNVIKSKKPAVVSKAKKTEPAKKVAPTKRRAKTPGINKMAFESSCYLKSCHQSVNISF